MGDDEKTVLEQGRWNTNKSGATGIIWRKDNKKWRAYITVNRKRINLGSFESKEDAVNARQEAEKILELARRAERLFLFR